MLNIRMKQRQAFLFIALILILVGLNAFFMFTNRVEITDMPEMVDHSHISSQKLFDNSWKIIRDSYYDSDLNEQSWARWKEHYHGKIKTDEDAKVAIDTMLASLNDPYSRYMSRDEYLEQNNSINSKITGIGVNIASIAGKIHIINVMEGTPAQFANLLPKDIIIAIDGKEVNGLPLSEVANLVRGPENSFVNITVLRNNDKLVKKVIASHIGTTPETGRQMHDGEIEVELVPMGTLIEKIRAKGSGLGGVLTPTGVGTIIEESKETMEVDGKKYIFEKPLGADFALIYGTKVDKYGNVCFHGTTRNHNTIMATAAETVIVQADEIVDCLDPNDVVIPGLFVDYVVCREG